MNRKMKLTALLTEMRSYMADVTGRQHWSPIHDKLHYALIEGTDGEHRWHLVHPDAMHHIQPLIDAGKATLHDTLGGEIDSTGSLRLPYSGPKSIRANRVAAVVAEHPLYGKVVVKSGEQHADFVPAEPEIRSKAVTQVSDEPPRSLRWSEKPDPRAKGKNALLNLKSDLQPHEDVIRGKMGMNPMTYNSDGEALKKRPNDATPMPGISTQLHDFENQGYAPGAEDFGPNAQYVSEAAQIAGAPVVPLKVSEIGHFMDEANTVPLEENGYDSWHTPDQYASIQPYIHPFREAVKNYPVTEGITPPTPQDEHWKHRLQGRLDALEQIAGAPDRHGGNYVDVPAILPGGSITPVKHGIDYEFAAYNGGLLDGRSDEIEDHANQFIDPQEWEEEGGIDGRGDVLGSVPHIPLPEHVDHRDEDEHYNIVSTLLGEYDPEDEEYLHQGLVKAGKIIRDVAGPNDYRNPALALHKENP